MTYVYVEIAYPDPDDAAYADRVIEEACRVLNVPTPAVRWYAVEEVAGRYALTRFGRALDRPEDRSLHGWYRADPVPHVAIRADQSRHQIGMTAAHELRHLWQERHGRPINEDEAEAFAGRIVASL